MVVGRFTIRRWATDQLEVDLHGELSAHTLSACETELRAQLSATKTGTLMVLVDLLRVDNYTLEARDALVGVQRFLGGKASQTAIVAATAAGRGLGLWVTHVVEAQVIKTFADRDVAKAWLAQRSAPTTGVRPLARGRSITPLVHTKKVAG